MKTVIVYESMFGNTHLIAEHLADAARRHGEVNLVPVSHARSDIIAGADLVIVGGPTHIHGMSWSATRHTAIADANKHDDLDPNAEGPGLRDWFRRVDDVRFVPAAAFDTRLDGNPSATGRASKGISRRLRLHDFHEIAEPESFLLDKDNELVPGEAERAQKWADSLYARLSVHA